MTVRSAMRAAAEARKGLADRFTRKQEPRPPLVFERVLRVGDEILHKGVAYVVVAINPGKGRASIEPKRGIVRTRPGGPVCVEQEPVRGKEPPCSEPS